MELDFTDLTKVIGYIVLTVGIVMLIFFYVTILLQAYGTGVLWGVLATLPIIIALLQLFGALTALPAFMDPVIPILPWTWVIFVMFNWREAMFPFLLVIAGAIIAFMGAWIGQVPFTVEIFGYTINTVAS